MSRIIIISAVFSGKINGQQNTARQVHDVLKVNFNVVKINRSIKDLFLPFLLFFKCIFFKLKKIEIIFYLFIHRTRVSFYFRDLPIFLIAIFTNSKIIVHLVGSDLDIFLRKLTFFERLLVLFCYRKTSCWVILGEKMRSQIAKIFKNYDVTFQSVVVPGFYDQSFMNFNNKVDRNHFKVGFMSNFIREKGICEFIDAIIICNEKKNLKITAWIAGQLVNKDEVVKNKIEMARGKNYIEIYQPILGDLKWNLLHATGIFVLPTYYKTESLPLSLVDAMRSGCFCISNDVGEIGNLLSNNRGEIITDITENHIADAIEAVIKSSNTITSTTSNAMDYVENNFSYSCFSKSIIKIIDDL